MKREALLQWGIPTLLLIATTALAWLLRGILTLANFTTIYLLIVLEVAIRSGTRVALTAAIISFLSINFFLVHPYYTFIIADPREVIDLIIFLIVALLVGQLAANARQQAHEAQQRAREQAILFRLTRAINRIATPQGVYEALIATVKTDLGARAAFVMPYESPDQPAQNQTVYYVLLQAGDQIFATLCAAFDLSASGEVQRLLNACVTQAAMALQRIDLTERARKSQQFEEADRLKTALLHAVSHDLRTPITIIKSSAGNLRRLDADLNADQRKELSQAIEAEADQLDTLVGNLLDMSRLQAGALALNCQPNSLEEVAGDVAARVFQRLKQERIALFFADDLPLVPFDYGLIRQALANLVDNALRYEPPDRKIELRGHVLGPQAHLWVINHGANITPQEREHLMEPFYRGRDGHVGLGLPIADGIVAAHHGQLIVEDTPGGGATFIIALPMPNPNPNPKEDANVP